MSLIRPGIHENLMISNKTKINEEYGTLELVIKSMTTGDAELAAFENNLVDVAMESPMRFYIPNLMGFGDNAKIPKNSADLGTELRKIKFTLTQYALIYAPQKVVDDYIGGMKMFEGLGVPPDQYGKAILQLTNKEWLEKVCTNLFTKFIGFLTAANAYSGQITFRQKFLRQSKDKNWAVVPNSDISIWIEPMTIPKEQSKIEWTKWEIDNGKNDPNPSASSGTANTKTTDVNAGKDLFGAQPEVAAPAALGTVAPATSIATALGTVAPPIVPATSIANPALEPAPIAPAPVVPVAPIVPVTPAPVTPAVANSFFSKP